jgi:hypothetical protein
MIFRRAGGDSPDVILVDRMDVTTDYLARKLTGRGARVHLYTPFPKWPLPFLLSAYPYRSLQGEPFGDSPSDSFATLVERVDPACIIPCTESALYWLWQQSPDIQERCLPKVGPAIRPLLLDRALLLEKAAGWGVATPDSIPLNSHDDCHAAVATGLPLMVKSGQSSASNGVALCHTPDDVIRAFDKFFLRGTSVSAQRYYVGPTYMAGALFVHGEAAHFYAAEQTVMWPPLTGYSHEIRSVGEPYLSTLLQATEAVCKNLEWTGLASFDFVLGEDGQFRFVDFNPRLWGSAGAMRTARMDLYGGVDRLIRYGDAGPPSRSAPDISYRVFPKYTVEPSDLSMRRRLLGLLDGPWDTPFLAASEIAYKVAMRLRAG